jgi:4-hydroxybenzoyl-CoA reductase subunit beta
MLRLPELNILTPATLSEAIEHLRKSGATVVAGGTDLYPNLKRRQVEHNTLVSLAGVAALKGISGDPQSGMLIGAMTTLTEIVEHAQINSGYPALARAAYLVSTPQLRNSGTLGGNVCLDTRCMYYNQNALWRQALGYCLKACGSICQVAPKSPRCFAVSSADTVPVLLALAARLRLTGPEGEREIPIEAFYLRDGINYLTRKAGEIVTAIVLPPAGTLKMTYLKMRKRNSIDFPVAGVAAALETDADNKITRARVVLGALDSCPILLDQAATLMVGNELTSEIIDQVAELAFKTAKPLDNTDMGPAYRKQMARVLTARALRQLADSP